MISPIYDDAKKTPLEKRVDEIIEELRGTLSLSTEAEIQARKLMLTLTNVAETPLNVLDKVGECKNILHEKYVSDRHALIRGWLRGERRNAHNNYYLPKYASI